MPFNEDPFDGTIPGGGGTVNYYGGGGGGAWGAVAAAAAAAYDTYQTSETAKRNTDKTIKANKQEAELAYQRQMEMWHAQNAYNSPAAQMARFKQAGLNPHLIYGQGNPGNAGTPPAYQPPNIQYRYEAGRYGSAVASILPTIMQVGSWLQHMRQGEVQIAKDQQAMRKTDVDIEKLREVVDQMRKTNPELLRKLENTNALYEYQSQMLSSQAQKARLSVHELGAKMRLEFGDEWWKATGSPGPGVALGGMAKEKLDKAISEAKLKRAQASWSEFDVTNPQQLMMFVLSSVMGLAGSAMKLPSGAGFKGGETKPSRPRERPRGLNRRRMSPNHPDWRK